MSKVKSNLRVPAGVSDDLVNEILLWLPVKSLAQYKSVCKSWLSLISSPKFVKSHLLRSGDNQLLIVGNYKADVGDSFSLLTPTSRVVLDFPFSESRFLRAVLDFPFSVVGSDCGIVCVHVVFDNIYLWNPATRQCKLIPSDDIEDAGRSGSWRLTLGFGFDGIDNDYKVVRILSPDEQQVGDEVYVDVYSANRNVWCEVGPNPTYCHGIDSFFHECVNGILCFCGGSDDLVTFDLNKEVLNRAIKLPDDQTFDWSITRWYHNKGISHITNSNDLIAVITCKRYENNNSKINLWALDDEACLRDGGIEVSWTLMLNIDVSMPLELVCSYFKTGDLLVLVDGIWCLYNSVNKVVRNFQDFDSSSCVSILKYAESLVTIPGFKNYSI